MPSGKADRQRAHDYVAGMVERAPNRSLVRWRARICPLVAGLGPGQGEYVLRRLSEVAREARAPLGGRDCRPNLYIVASDEPQRLLELWRDHDRRLFGQGLPASIARFIATDRPVRVWHNWSYEHPDGRPTRDSADYNGTPTLRFAKTSRLLENAVRNAGSVIVVVDTGKLDGVTVNQLADYVAMASFTQLRPDAAARGAPSILALFEDVAEPPPGLSAWDVAFLRALYATATESRTQRAEIAGRVLREVRAGR